MIPEYIFGFDKESLEEIVGELLSESKKTVSTAESCTGGNIASMITSVPGSSEYFIGSVVAYSNEVKEDILKVGRGNIEEYGAVSRQVVEEMAQGVRDVYNTDFSIATSGIAGPGGGVEDKPVGTTWVAVASVDEVISEKFLFGEDRGRNIRKASLTGLSMLRKLIKM